MIGNCASGIDSGMRVVEFESCDVITEEDSVGDFKAILSTSFAWDRAVKRCGCVGLN